MSHGIQAAHPLPALTPSPASSPRTLTGPQVGWGSREGQRGGRGRADWGHMLDPLCCHTSRAKLNDPYLGSSDML